MSALKVIYHPLYSMNKFVTNKLKVIDVIVSRDNKTT